MNMLLCVSGNRQSGKTTKLIREFKKCLSYIRRVVNPETEYGLRCHYIMFVPYAADSEIVSKFIETNGLKDLGNSTVSHCGDFVDVINKVKEVASISNCNIFIDRCIPLYGVDVNNAFQTMLDEFNNSSPRFRVEIMYTRLIPNNSKVEQTSLDTEPVNQICNDTVDEEEK